MCTSSKTKSVSTVIRQLAVMVSIGENWYHSSGCCYYIFIQYIYSKCPWYTPNNSLKKLIFLHKVEYKENGYYSILSITKLFITETECKN